MSGSLGWWRALVAAAVVICVGVAVAASGQAAKSGASAGFGTVDVQEVTSKYQAMQVAQSELAARQGKANARIQRRVNMPFLSDEEHKELDDLDAKEPAGRTAAETARLKELTDKGMKLSGEIAALQQKPDTQLTDPDRQRFKDAETARARMEQRIVAVRDEEDNKLREFGLSNQERLTKQFRAAVKRVAEKRGISIVFDVQVAVYAGTDITAEVLKDLNTAK